MKNKTDITKAGLIKLQAEQKKARAICSALDARMKKAKEHFIGKAKVAPGDTIHGKKVQTIKCFANVDLVLSPRNAYTVEPGMFLKFKVK